MKHRIIYTLALMLATLQASAQTYTYDKNNRLSKVEYANGITVNYTYDALGNRTGKKVTGGSDAPQEVSESDLPGDFNNNGKWDAADVDYLSQAIMEGNQPTLSTDLNQDDKLNVADVVVLLKAVNEGSWPITHDYVDLGLPSGTLWATCNVGAMKPEDVGGYYAWGETKAKDNYEWSNYSLSDGGESSCYDIGSDIADTQYDVARTKWGDPWRMPTLKDWEEIIMNCSWTKSTQNNVSGLKITSRKNGNCIFLPFTGCRWDTGVYYTETLYGWLSDISSKGKGFATYLIFQEDKGIGNGRDFERFIGLTVRPVIHVENSGSTTVSSGDEI